MKIYRFESYIIVIVVLITVFLNLTTFFYRSFTTPKDRYFAGTQFYSDDYAIYVSDIKQGQEGRWAVVNSFTSEPHSSSLVHEEYLLWGKLTGIFGIPPVLSYHLSRLIFGLVFLVMIYLFLLKAFPLPRQSILRIVSLLLICFASGFLDKTGQPYLSWLTEMDISQKFGALLHYLLGFICLLGIFGRVYARNTKLLYFFILGLLGGFVLPSSMIVVVSTLVAFAVIFPDDRKYLQKPLLAIIAAGLPIAIYYRLTFNVFPWNIILDLERINKGPFTLVEFLSALGAISFLAPLGLLAWKNERRLVSFLSTWILVVFGWAFVLADIFGLNPTRFLQIPIYIPLSMMTVLGFKMIFKKNWLLVVAVGLMIAVSLPTTVKSLKNHLQMYADHSELIYPGKDLMESFGFLDRNTRSGEAVLTLYQAGNLIPFLAGNTVYLGHFQGTINYPQKVEKAGRFFAGRMTVEEAKQFLSEANVNLVFYSPQERSAGGKIDQYTFLSTTYSNATVTIYRVNQP